MQNSSAKSTQVTAFAEVQQLAAAINKKYPAVKAEARISENSGRFEIEVATVDKAKALFQMFGFSKGVSFTCGSYK